MLSNYYLVLSELINNVYELMEHVLVQTSYFVARHRKQL